MTGETTYSREPQKAVRLLNIKQLALLTCGYYLPANFGATTFWCTAKPIIKIPSIITISVVFSVGFPITKYLECYIIYYTSKNTTISIYKEAS